MFERTIPSLHSIIVPIVIGRIDHFHVTLRSQLSAIFQIILGNKQLPLQQTNAL